MHDKADLIINNANAFVGTRYRKQGRSENGLDCAGLIIVTAKYSGISNFDTTRYSDRPNAEEFVKSMRAAKCQRLRRDQLANGDILRLNTEGWPVHIAIFEVDEHGREWYIHAYLPHRKVTRDPMSDDVWSRVEDVWRFPK